MLSPYGLDIIESCLTCKMRADQIFCDLPTSALQAFEPSNTPPPIPRARCCSSRDRRRAESSCSAKDE